MPVPVNVIVRAPEPDSTGESVLVKLITFDGVAEEEAIAPPFGDNVKSRSVLCDALPTHCNVPPSSTRFAAAFDDWPIELTAPPFASELTFNVVPPVTVVTPEYVLDAFVNATVPPPLAVRPEVF